MISVIIGELGKVTDTIEIWIKKIGVDCVVAEI